MLRELRTISTIVRNGFATFWLARRIRVENHTLRRLDADEEQMPYRRRSRLSATRLSKAEQAEGLSPWDAQLALHQKNPLYWSHPKNCGDTFGPASRGGR